MIDAWSRKPQPQEFRRGSTGGFDDLLDVIRKQGDRLRDSTKNLLGSAGIRLKPGRMVVEQSLDVEGDLTATGSTTIGGRLDVTGNARFSGDTTIGGNAAITGTLSLPAGIIGNDALATPIEMGAANASQTGFALSGTSTPLAVGVIPIPAGFSRATVHTFSTMSVILDTTSTPVAYLAAAIDGVSGLEQWGLLMTSSPTVTIAASSVRELGGLNGGAITVSCMARATAAIGVTAANSANTTATVTFRR